MITSIAYIFYEQVPMQPVNQKFRGVKCFTSGWMIGLQIAIISNNQQFGGPIIHSNSDSIY